MTVRVVLRKGSNTIHSEYVGHVGELTYDTDNNTIRIHNGNTAGGVRTALLNSNGTIVATNLVAVSTITTSNLNSTNIITRTIAANSLTANAATIGSISSNSIQANTANITTIAANAITSNAFVSNSINTNFITTSNATITSGVINQVQIGLTTPNTAAFTSVTVNSQPTTNTQLANKLYVDKKVRLAVALSGV